MKQTKKQTVWRMTVGVCAPLLLALVLWYLYAVGEGPGCLLWRLTGIYCPGCGTGRATVALLHGRVLLALRQNALAVLLLPVVCYYALKRYLAFVLWQDVLPFPRVGRRTAFALLILVCLFWIARNLPFSFLQPI